MSQKTRKHKHKYKCKKQNTKTEKCLASNNDAKKGILLKCKLKTCKAVKYQSLYGSLTGGMFRTPRQLFY